MNKKDLIESIAASSRISKAEAAKVLDSILSTISGQLKKGSDVSIRNFGKFEVSSKKARTGRNPQTGQAIRIDATKVPRFKSAKALCANVKERWTEDPGPSRVKKPRR